MTTARLPSRIVCLTTETVEVLYALGEDRIAGISGYTVIPPRARKEKPKVFAFSSGDLEKILAVEPDLVLGFSDMQADVARDLIKAGVTVHVFNQRSIDGILAMIETIGRLVGAAQRALALVAELEAMMEAVRARAAALPRRPRVYFEEWDEPPISAVGWVSELIAIAGGEDVFAERARHPGAAQRILADPLEAARRAPTSSSVHGAASASGRNGSLRGRGGKRPRRARRRVARGEVGADPGAGAGGDSRGAAGAGGDLRALGGASTRVLSARAGSRARQLAVPASPRRRRPARTTSVGLRVRRSAPSGSAHRRRFARSAPAVGCVLWSARRPPSRRAIRPRRRVRPPSSRFRRRPRAVAAGRARHGPWRQSAVAASPSGAVLRRRCRRRWRWRRPRRRADRGLRMAGNGCGRARWRGRGNAARKWDAKAKGRPRWAASSAL